jgi:precorrin-2/cobalt-factor-2 C20-methyltransferase
MTLEFGTLCGISIGTGDPELITVKGLRLLQHSPVIAFPAGKSGQPGIAEAIVAPYLRPDQIRLPLVFPYVQDESVLTEAWDVAADQVWRHLKQGFDVGFACEGDISFYSTFNYLFQTIQSRYPEAKVETVPGVCSPLAAASALGIPLTIRNEKLAILPALYNVSELESALQWAEVVVLMKVSSVYSQVWQILDRYHLLERSYIVERATSTHQKIYAGLTHRSTLSLPYFSILIVKVTNSL